MRSSSFRSILLLVLVFAVSPAFAKKITHTNVVPPKVAIESPAGLAPIGVPMRLLEYGGTIYVAGKSGIAAMSPDGRVLWAVPLDVVGVRELAVDDKGIAYTGFEVTGEKMTGLSFFGDVPDKLKFAPSTIGLLTPAGQKVWQVHGPESRISAPCLSPEAIGVLNGGTFQIYARTDGRVTTAKVDLEAAMFPNEFASRNFRPRPMWINDNFVGGYAWNMYRIAPNGDLIEKDTKNRMLMVAGPTMYKGNLLLGSYTLKPDGNVNVGVVYNRRPDAEFKEVWSEDISDDRTATGDIVVDGDMIYASSNRSVTMLDGIKGKKVWTEEGDEGGLSSGSMRGVRFAKQFGYHWWGGNLMVVVGDRLYLSTRREISKKNWADVITVLDKKTGAYVKTIDMQKDLVDFLPLGDRLVVASADGVKFLALD